MEGFRRPRRATIVLAALAAATAVVAVAAPAFGGAASVSTLVPGSSLDAGNGLAETADGDLLMTHVLRDRISRVDPDGGAPQTWHAPGGPNEGFIPDDISLGPGGDAFVTEFWDPGFVDRIDGETGAIHRVAAIDANGSAFPNGVEVHPSGRVFVSPLAFDDETRSAVWEVDPTGVQRAERVTEPVMLAPEGFDTGPDGDLYVPAFYSGKVWRVDVDGAGLEGGTTEPELVAEGFGYAVALTFLGNGSFAVADTSTGEVIGYDLDKEHHWTIAQLPRPGQDNLQEAGGDLFVSSFIHGGLTRIDLDTGEVTRRNHTPLGTPNDLTGDGSGDLLVANFLSVSKVTTPSGEVSEEFTFGVSLDTVGLGLHPTAIDRAPDGKVWWAETFSKFRRWNPATGDVTTLADTTTPVALEAEGDLVLLVDQSAGTLLRWDPTAGELATVAGGLRNPSGLAISPGPGSTDTVYVSEAGAVEPAPATGASDPGLVHRYVLEDGEVAEHTVVPADLDRPEGLEVLADGDLLVVESGSGALTHLDPVTGATSQVADGLGTQGAEGLFRVAGLLEYTAGLEVQGSTAYVTNDDGAIHEVSLPGVH